MTSSYSLRIRQKQQSPILKKTISNSPPSSSKPIARTSQKPLFKVSSQSTLQVPQISSTIIVSTNDLLTNAATNNQVSNLSFHSNYSQIESNILVRRRKGKFEEVQVNKQQDNLESLELDGYAQLKFSNIFKYNKKNYSEIDSTKPKKQKKIRRISVVGVPYRKFQSQLQQKVVTMINKIKQGKNCSKELQKLVIKLNHTQKKDLKNRFFISGIAIITKLVKSPQFVSFYPAQLIQKIDSTFQILLQKVTNQMDNIHDFIQIQQSPQALIKSSQLISRIFKILRQKHRNKSREIVQQKSINIVLSYTNRDKNKIDQQGQLTQCKIKDLYKKLNEVEV